MKKILCISTALWVMGCSNIIPYVGARKQIKEFNVNDLTLFLITNIEQFPVKPKNPNTLGMWILRYGISEEIWICAEVHGEIWSSAPGVLEHELIHALRHRDKLAIQDPDVARAFGAIIVLHETQR